VPDFTARDLLRVTEPGRLWMERGRVDRPRGARTGLVAGQKKRAVHARRLWI